MGIKMITIIDYRAGNITSVKRALDYLEIPNKISSDKDEIKVAERIIFPGVGHAKSAMTYLNESKIGDAITTACSKNIPMLGICLGTQIILSFSEEGDVECLDLISGKVKKIVTDRKDLKVPHMGWDNVNFVKNHYVFRENTNMDKFYFVHSYYVEPSLEEDIIGTCDYQKSIPVILGRKNIVSVQFHPEKSGKAGLNILKQFSTWELD